MAVIAEFSVPAEDFTLGQILALDQGERIELETVVPLGETVMHFFWIHAGREDFADAIRSDPQVEDLHIVESKDGKELYALDWPAKDDKLLDTVLSTEGRILNATGGTDQWKFETRFPSHDLLSEFSDHCRNAGIDVNLDALYNPTKPDAGPFYGLTPAQREAVMLAVQEGYYALPREASTQDLADELGISAQAVTERLRRGFESLVENTLLIEQESD